MLQPPREQYRASLRIDMNAIKQNYSLVRNMTSSKICCVVKANAYGHGLVEMAKFFESQSADYLAVGNIEEALSLRDNGIEMPILILGYTPVENAILLAENNITQCVFSSEYGYALHSYLENTDLKIKIHIKIDTGMGRLGFIYHDHLDNELKDAIKIAQLSHFSVEGIFTHFAVADEGEQGYEYTYLQFNRFLSSIKYFEDHGISFQLRHCVNSAALCLYPDFHLDMVRAGCILYGIPPMESMAIPGLKYASSFVSVISSVKELNKGESVSYGRLYIAPENKKVAVVPLGYSDGFNRKYSRYKLRVNGFSVPIIGNICMNQLMIDVTDINCKEGDVVYIWMDTDTDNVSKLAKFNDSICEEILCSISADIPRVYLN